MHQPTNGKPAPPPAFACSRYNRCNDPKKYISDDNFVWKKRRKKGVGFPFVSTCGSNIYEVNGRWQNERGIAVMPIVPIMYKYRYRFFTTYLDGWQIRTDIDRLLVFTTVTPIFILIGNYVFWSCQKILRQTYLMCTNVPRPVLPIFKSKFVVVVVDEISTFKNFIRFSSGRARTTTVML